MIMDKKTRESLDSLSQLWAENSCNAIERQEDDVLARLIEDDEEYADEYFDSDEFE